VSWIDELEALGRHYKLRLFLAEPTDYLHPGKIRHWSKLAISQIFNKV